MRSVLRMGMARALAVLACRPRSEAWILALLCLDLAAIGDLATGSTLWFGPVYLVVMSIATWSLGWMRGQAVGIACMALTFAINGAALYPYGGAALGWNLAMRFLAISVVIAVIAGARRVYIREWWLARTDLLTGALNRQAFFELGGSLADSQSWRLLVYTDLDGFKAINDGRGHAAGDACLKDYAAAVRGIIRRSDLFARVGGDEFLIFLTVRDEASARAVATRLHAAMNCLPSAIDGQVRCSVGALVVPPGAMALDPLVSAADRLMYQAKERGADVEIGTAATSGAGTPAGRARWQPRAPGLPMPLPARIPVERRSSNASVGFAL